MTGEPAPDHGRSSLSGKMSAAAVYAVPLAVALYTRTVAFSAAFERPLEGDASAFYKLASAPVSLFSASEREPFFMLLHRSAYLAMHGDPNAIRIQSMIFSLVLVALVTWAARRKAVSALAAALPGLMLALTPYMAFSAARGLRLELFVCLCIGLAAVLFVEDGKLSWVRAISAGLLAAAVCLTRQVGIAVAAILFAAALARALFSKRLDYAKWITAAVIALLLTSPFYVSQRIEYESAFHIGDKDATFWRNQEFRDRPGFHASAEITVNPYLGPRVTPGKYVFGMHSTGEVVERVARGYYLCFSFFYPRALFFAWPLLLLALPGAVAVIVRRQWQWLLLLALLILPFAFIIPVPVVGHGSTDARFAMHGFPLVCLLIGAGMDYLIELAGRLRDRRTGTD